ncbi:dihydrolipoamide acetyltransferase family protein [Glutamicibacter endophyticus]|uniref:dihydrolipoamide acetyltransferase family protein n=1 Tax=Glutamicibacter endophyticus TaxID=1522174 RepID=UPI003AF0D62A
MSATQVFTLPDLGEGLTESEVLNWKVEVGQEVSLNQVIAEVETAKAVVELPCPYAGVVAEIHAEPGTVVPVGGPLLTISSDSEAPTSDKPAPKRTPTLVGYGAPSSGGHRPARRRRGSALAAAVPVPDNHALAEEPSERRYVTRSTPPVRKLARDHGIDLESIQGTGPEGLVTREDVQALIAPPASSQPREEATSGTAETDRDQVIIPSAVRKATAAAMVSSAFTAPHVTEFLTVDVTESLALVEQLRAHRSLKDTKINFTTFAAFTAVKLLARHRALNSIWVQEHGHILQRGTVNLGMAVASERGLLVPVVHDASAMTLDVFAKELSELIRQGREGTLSPAQLTGGTFSVTNVGVFGVDAGTPIIPPGQSGIIALGQVARRPWEYRGEVALRHTTTLALSFDHRVIDGKEGSEFLADLGQILTNPGMVNLFA